VNNKKQLHIWVSSEVLESFRDITRTGERGSILESLILDYVIKYRPQKHEKTVSETTETHA